MTREEIVVGLDIGTTKVCTVIGQGTASTGAPGEETGQINVIGVGVVPSRGIKKGVVVDVEDTISAIRDSVERAAHMAGVQVEGAVAGVTGEHVQSSNRRGTVTVASPNNAISRFDVERVLQAAALEIPRDREIIHSLPRDFIVDGHPGVKRPIGMTGQRLEVETHVVTGKASFLQNAVKCVEQAGLNVEALVLEPIATAEAVTTNDEREMGVILIDIGGGTSDVAVFVDGSIVYSAVLPVGGNHVTRDIAIGLRTPFEIAEKLKIDRGAATRDLIPHGEALEVLMAGSGERLRIPRALLGEIIEARMSELFELSREAMHVAGVRKRLAGGVILSGGGALLPGALDLCSDIFQMPVRLGLPNEISGWSDQVANPQFATGVGLCRFALQQRYAPGNQAAIPAIASSEGRRIWGAIAPGPLSQAAPPVEVVPEAPTVEAPPVQEETEPNEAPADSGAEMVPVPKPNATVATAEITPFDGNGASANSAPANASAPPQANNRRENFFRRDETASPAAQNGAAPSLWQKIWVKFRELIGFEAP